MESKVKYSIHSALVFREPCSRYKFSKVVLLLKVSRKITVELTFQNFHPACVVLCELQRLHALMCIARCFDLCCSVLQCVAVCCSVLQCVAVYMHCCTSRAASTCVAVCCSLLRTSHTTAPRTLPRPMYI